MAEGDIDFAVFGSTAFARLLAGVLANVHGKRVCLVGERWSPYRLQRRIDLSVTAASRPATWALLKREVPEALKLFGTIGRGLYERVDPLFVAETPDRAAFLGHMRWMALGYGFAAERAVDRAITATGSICRIRDAAMLVAAKAEPAIDDWTDKADVSRLAPGDTSLTLRRDGASLSIGSRTFDVGSVVLADDDAILDRLPVSDRHRLLTVSTSTGVAIEPTGTQGATLASYLDRDTMVFQRTAKAPIAAIAGGDAYSAVARIAASIPANVPLRRSGQCVFRTVATADGAPLVGPMGRSRTTVVAGLGHVSAFLAPALAGVLAGTAAVEVAEYFAARAPSRGAARADVAEWSGSLAAEATA